MSYTMEEYDEYERKMHEKYPLLFSQPYGGIAVGKGWWPMIEQLSATIQSHIDQNKTCPQVVVQQVKEKFGTLRFYYDGGDDFVHGAVWFAEGMTGLLCEECGGLGTRRSGGWVRTLCDVHEAERQARYEEQARKDGLEL